MQGREWQEAAEVGRDQVTHSSACEAVKPEFDPEGPPPLTGAQEPEGTPHVTHFMSTFKIWTADHPASMLSME